MAILSLRARPLFMVLLLRQARPSIRTRFKDLRRRITRSVSKIILLYPRRGPWNRNVIGVHLSSIGGYRIVTQRCPRRQENRSQPILSHGSCRCRFYVDQFRISRFLISYGSAGGDDEGGHSS